MAKKKKVIYNRPNINKLKTSAKSNSLDEKKAIEEKTVEEVEVVTPDEVVEVAEVNTEEKAENIDVLPVKSKKKNKETLSVEEPVKKGKQTKVEKNDKAKKQTKKEPREKKLGLAKRAKETMSELKKVSWPKFGKVVKSTGVVITVVVVFTLVLFGMDRLLSWLYNFIPR